MTRSFPTSSLAALSVAALALASAVGCQSTHKPAPAPVATPMSADAFESLRTEFTSNDPTTKIAQVTDVLPEASSLRFGGSAADFPVGSIVTVVDADKQPIANGRVFASRDEANDADFTTISGKPRPIRGDAVVKFADQPAASASNGSSNSGSDTAGGWGAVAASQPSTQSSR